MLQGWHAAATQWKKTAGWLLKGKGQGEAVAFGFTQQEQQGQGHSTRFGRPSFQIHQLS